MNRRPLHTEYLGDYIWEIQTDEMTPEHNSRDQSCTDRRIASRSTAQACSRASPIIRVISSVPHRPHRPGLTTYSLQNHLRTHVKGMGQIEIDEIYVGLNRNGAQYVIPVQAKGGSDKLSPVQTMQDIACCEAKFPDLICRPVSAQFKEDGVIALFELTVEAKRVLIIEERHYRLVPSDQIDANTRRQYAERS